MYPLSSYPFDQYILRLTLSEKNKTMDSLLSAIAEGKFKPVTYSDVHEVNIPLLFSNLSPLPVTRKRLTYQAGNRYRSSVLPDGTEGYVKITKDDYAKASMITDFYQELVKMRAKTSRSQYSVDDVWYSYARNMPQDAKDILKNLLTESIDDLHKMGISDDDIHYDSHTLKAVIEEKLYKLRLHPSSYHITIVLTIVQLMGVDIKSMLDPFAGWGDRLTAAIKMEVDYTGCDPNSDLFPGYNAIIDDLGGGNREKYKMLNIGFEDFTSTKKYDCIISSPPYGPIEIYSSDQSQSWSKFGLGENPANYWLENFYRPAIIKAWSYINDGGYMCLQINDHGKFRFVGYTLSIMFKQQHCDYIGCLITESHNGFKNQNHIWIKR